MLWFHGHQLYCGSAELPSLSSDHNPRSCWYCCHHCRQRECQAGRRARGCAFCKVNVCRAGILSPCASSSQNVLDHIHVTTPSCRKSRKCLFRWTIECSYVSVTKEEGYISLPSSSFPLVVKLFSHMVLSCH